MQKFVPELTELLTLNRTKLQRKMYKREDKELPRQFLEYCREMKMTPDYTHKDRFVLQITDFLRLKINTEIEAIADLRRGLADFNQRLHTATSDHERQEHILAFAARMGADKQRLQGDRRAFRRWFGADTVVERCQRRIAGSEYRIADILDRLGNAVVAAVESGADGKGQETTWERIDLEGVTRNLLVYQGDPRVRRAAFACIARGIASLQVQFQLSTLQEVTVTFVYRSAMAIQEDVWIQCAALNLLALTSPDSFLQALGQRLGHPQGGDDIFVRRRAVRLLGTYPGFHCRMASLISYILDDPSPFVRQALAETLADVLCSEQTEDRSQVWQLLQKLMLEDTTVQVRACAVLTLARLHVDPLQEVEKMDLLKTVMTEEESSLVLKIALDVIAQGLDALMASGGQDSADMYTKELLPHVVDLHRHAAALSVRRYAALTREKMIISADSASRDLKEQLADLLQGMKCGESRRLPRLLLKKYGEDAVGRILSLLSQKDFGYSLHATLWGVRVTKGDTFAFRWWRLLHEIRNPKTDKRQGYSHTIGRRYTGSLHAPSAILGELTRTKVPGEPLYMDSEESWRPYLPLPDQVLSCLQNPFRRQPVKLYTAEGITEIRPSRSCVRSWLGAGKLIVNFARFAHKRNWEEDGSEKPEEYIRALEKLGLGVVFSPHKDENGEDDSDPSVERFFLLPLPLMGSDWYYRLRDYFFSVYENTLQDLAVFTLALLLFFVGTRFVMSRIAIRSRRKIDLVVGGWGTRGKSGTERLKAALFEGLGHSLVSKSTGCEAMFLYAYPFGKTREMFLFRPYDKATIWEQYDVVRLSTKLSARIFLWECMALSPDYVRILQHQWMRDDISTITNTYPDHEDLQGPAGYNIPIVMTEFIPKGGNLLTTEEQMLPILELSAAQSGTKFQSVGWQQAGILAPDILNRFPYEEHPYNIALVEAMAKELGIDPDFALKEMADRVIADIGVLLEFPRARVRSRDLQFINGMSANERFGAMSNWRRMGFDSHDPRKEPGVILSTVVNNRADRVSRTLMFAGIVVFDFAADFHFLIGSNLEGLVGYIHEALDACCLRITLQPEDKDKNSNPLQILEEVARKQRMPTSREELQARLVAMLIGVGLEDDDLPEGAFDDTDALHEWLGEHSLGELSAEILAEFKRQKDVLDSYLELYSQVEHSGKGVGAEQDEQLRRLVRKWFLQKLIVVEDYHATGDQVIDRICRHTPPGLHNRIMGLQNIKGTGLDFVYRWQAWDICYQACEKLVASEGAEFDRALHELSAFQEYGLLSEYHVEKTCELVGNRSSVQAESSQAEIALIKSNMETALTRIKSDLSGAGTRKEKSVVKDHAVKFVGFIESMIDAGDAVRRRKRANRIYKDLAEERISGERAVKELKALNRRQKGGWLWTGLQRIMLH